MVPVSAGSVYGTTTAHGRVEGQILKTFGPNENTQTVVGEVVKIIQEEPPLTTCDIALIRILGGDGGHAIRNYVRDMNRRKLRLLPDPVLATARGVTIMKLRDSADAERDIGRVESHAFIYDEDGARVKFSDCLGIVSADGSWMSYTEAGAAGCC